MKTNSTDCLEWHEIKNRLSSKIMCIIIRNTKEEYKWNKNQMDYR